MLWVASSHNAVIIDWEETRRQVVSSSNAAISAREKTWWQLQVSSYIAAISAWEETQVISSYRAAISN